MKRNVVVVTFVDFPFWVLHLSTLRSVYGRADPPLSSMSAPISSPFYASASSAATYSPGIEIVSSKQDMDPNRTLFIALISASGVVLGAIILVMGCLWRIYHCKKRIDETIHTSVKGKPRFPSYVNCSKENSCVKKCVSLMEYETLELATNNFRESEILGKGGFSCVYKGKLEDDSFVAVKKLQEGVTQDDDAIQEFETEVELLSKIQHPNVISLFGYSIRADTRLIVYELMENGSLEDQLHGPSRGSALTWNLRMKIAVGIASGLEYLHECCNPPIIHRDLKSSNILLDSNFNAKLSDFGLAVPDGAQNKNDAKLSGTLGYVAPEYLLDGKLTDKSDVYAFGVVLLELLLGRRAMEKLAQGQCQSIVSWAMPELTDRSKLPNIVDSVIRNTMDLKHLYQVAAVAVLCVQPEPSYRPLITDVLHSLIPLVPIELGGTLRASATAQNS
ncbi:PREDICTED: probable receptor-like protein kinase At1g80640 isoform X2 [Ipomoea nil]|uniref:probable receptor-like protein kinase At1g80640 isoform X2 n=1 Tax=Ipomoea nil TaxID=35883 RepID=UPI0009013F76|nr:PREDICTED: probable receptor-like protein kinase At1g80640 isoform X2 [Ipomoea nil]